MFKKLEIEKLIRNWKLEIGNFQKGFTLIEVVIYVGIFASAAALVTVSVFQIFNGTKLHRERLAVESEADFILQKIAWVLSDAYAIHEPVGGGTSTRLSASKAGFSGNPVAIRLASGTVELSRASGTYRALSSSHVLVHTLTFDHIPVAVQSPEGLAITLGIRASGTDSAAAKASTTIKSTLYLRQ